MANVGWADYPNGDYRLLPSSPYKAHATDGKDVGADIDALEAAQGKVAIHNASPGADGSSATVTFLAPDTQGCPVDVSPTDSTLTTALKRFPKSVSQA